MGHDWNGGIYFALCMGEVTSPTSSADLYYFSSVRTQVMKMTKCKCGDSKHHKEMSDDERLDHLKECFDEALERIQCVREELEKL